MAHLFLFLTNYIICHGRTKVEDEYKKQRKDAGRGRGPRERGRGRGRPEVIQSHSIFEQGPAEMMMKKRGSGFLWDIIHSDKTLAVGN